MGQILQPGPAGMYRQRPVGVGDTVLGLLCAVTVALPCVFMSVHVIGMLLVIGKIEEKILQMLAK
jgi:hypothetical protein